MWWTKASGEKYSQALDDTGLDIQTLTNYAWVANNLSTRRDSLSWSHHREVASLGPAEQAEALETAEREGMTVRQLRDYIKRPLIIPSEGRPAVYLSSPKPALSP